MSLNCDKKRIVLKHLPGGQLWTQKNNNNQKAHSKTQTQKQILLLQNKSHTTIQIKATILHKRNQIQIGKNSYPGALAPGLNIFHV